MNVGRLILRTVIGGLLTAGATAGTRALYSYWQRRGREEGYVVGTPVWDEDWCCFRAQIFGDWLVVAPGDKPVVVRKTASLRTGSVVRVTFPVDEFGFARGLEVWDPSGWREVWMLTHAEFAQDHERRVDLSREIAERQAERCRSHIERLLGHISDDEAIQAPSNEELQALPEIEALERLKEWRLATTLLGLYRDQVQLEIFKDTAMEGAGAVNKDLRDRVDEWVDEDCPRDPMAAWLTAFNHAPRAVSVVQGSLRLNLRRLTKRMVGEWSGQTKTVLLEYSNVDHVEVARVQNSKNGLSAWRDAVVALAEGVIPEGTQEETREAAEAVRSGVAVETLYPRSIKEEDLVEKVSANTRVEDANGSWHDADSGYLHHLRCRAQLFARHVGAVYVEAPVGEHLGSGF